MIARASGNASCVKRREIRQPATPDSAPQARALVEAAAAEQGLPGPSAWALMLATTEAVANAVEHGTPDGGAIALGIDSTADELCVEVVDGGSPGPPRPGPNRGNGIGLMVALVDHLLLEPGAARTRVRFGKRLRPA